LRSKKTTGKGGNSRPFKKNFSKGRSSTGRLAAEKSPRASSARDSKNHEIKVHGLHACKSLSDSRRQDVIRVYLTEARAKVFSSLMKWCAQEKKTYHLVSAAEMEKVTNSVHHEGVCILAKTKPFLNEAVFVDKYLGKPGCFLYLDGVGNPHNIGAILRTCAHFGIKAIIGEADKLLPLTPAAYRIAEGGAEHVELVFVKSGPQFFEKAKLRQYQLVGTSSHKGSSLYDAKLNANTIFILGAEVTGVTADSFAASSQVVQIPGSGDVESLNVSAATALLSGEYFRQHKQGK